MISRRVFLLGALGLSQAAITPGALARRKAKTVRSGIRSLARLDWPPAIVPDHVAFTDRGYSCLVDQFGRLAVADLKRADSQKVIGELTVSCKKVLDCAVLRHRAYLLTRQDTAAGDSEYAIVTVSLAPLSEPSVLSRVVLRHLSDASCITATHDLLCLAGTGSSGANEISVYSTRGRSPAPAHLATFTVPLPVVKLELQDRHLVVLESGAASQVDYVSLAYPDAPHVAKSMPLDGNYQVMTVGKGAILVAGEDATSKNIQAKTIALEPTPHVMQTETLSGFTSIAAACCQNNCFYLVGEGSDGRQLSTYFMGRDWRLSFGQNISLPPATNTPGAQTALAVKDRTLNLASGWQGVEVLTLKKGVWRKDFTYSIPRLPASAVAATGNLALLAGAGLELYSIENPANPLLIKTTGTDTAVKALALAGTYVLCLCKDALSLRKMDALVEEITRTPMIGQDLAYDASIKKAYVLNALDKKTLVTPVAAYSDRLTAEPAREFPAGFHRLWAGDGMLIMSDLSSVIQYDLKGGAQEAGKLELRHLAIRDMAVAGSYLAVAAVDHGSRGYLYLISREGGKLTELGSVSLPNDALALAVSDKHAAVVGRNSQGADLVAVVDISSPAKPKVSATIPSVEASSSVTIRDNLAIVGGRGLEILALG